MLAIPTTTIIIAIKPKSAGATRRPSKASWTSWISAPTNAESAVQRAPVAALTESESGAVVIRAETKSD